MTGVVALVEGTSDVIRYIGPSAEPKPRFNRHARSHRKGFRTLVLHDAVEVGDVATFVVQEEIAHAIRAGHPLLNELLLPVNLLEDPEVRAARDLALAAIAEGDGASADLSDLLALDRVMCAEQTAAPGAGVRQPRAHPTWRTDVRPMRTQAAPDGFRTVPDDSSTSVPLVVGSGAVASLLQRFAVVSTAAGLGAIADATVMWAADGSGPIARHNPDATAARFVWPAEDDLPKRAELRLPRREVGAILDRHVPGASDRLAAMDGMDVGRRDSLILITVDPEQLRELADALLHLAVEVDASAAKPVRQRTTSHDTQQILLRASQAIVLADELQAALEVCAGGLRGVDGELGRDTTLEGPL